MCRRPFLPTGLTGTASQLTVTGSGATDYGGVHVSPIHGFQPAGRASFNALPLCCGNPFLSSHPARANLSGRCQIKQYSTGSTFAAPSEWPITLGDAEIHMLPLRARESPVVLLALGHKRHCCAYTAFRQVQVSTVHSLNSDSGLLELLQPPAPAQTGRLRSALRAHPDLEGDLPITHAVPCTLQSVAAEHAAEPRRPHGGCFPSIPSRQVNYI